MANFRREVWIPALRSAKLPGIGLQVLRHSAVAAMIRAGASPKALQVILGHQSAGFTLTVYGHIFEQDVAKLAERLEVVVAVTKSRPRPKEDGTTDDGAPRLRVV